MTEHDLFKARQIWSALFAIGVDGVPDWAEWSYEKIGAMDYPAPTWLLDLCNASSLTEAAVAVNDSLGIELRNYDDSLDPDALALGFIYLLWLRAGTDLASLWRLLGKAVDVHQFVDSGRWRDFATSAGNLKGLSEAELTEVVFRPVSQYAENCMEKYLTKGCVSHLTLRSS